MLPNRELQVFRQLTLYCKAMLKMAREFHVMASISTTRNQRCCQRAKPLTSASLEPRADGVETRAHGRGRWEPPEGSELPHTASKAK
eukprot:1600178-Amphidinium_carterae.2